MITVTVPRRKRFPRLKKQDGTWIVLVRTLSLYDDTYKLWAEKLQEHADRLNRRELACRRLMREPHFQNIEDSIC